LYYGQSQSSSSSQTFVFSSEQISIGILTELFALIPSLLIVQLFRRLKSRPTNQNHQSILQQTLTQIRGYDQTLVKDVHPKKKPPFQLSWWWIFIAYGLSLSFIGISMFFIIIRGIQFGDVKTQQWLTSLIIGLFSSICLTQPLKILCLSIFFGFCLKTSNSDKEIAGHVDDDDVQIELNENEEYLHSMKVRFSFFRTEILRILFSLNVLVRLFVCQSSSNTDESTGQNRFELCSNRTTTRNSNSNCYSRDLLVYDFLFDSLHFYLFKSQFEFILSSSTIETFLFKYKNLYKRKIFSEPVKKQTYIFL